MPRTRSRKPAELSRKVTLQTCVTETMEAKFRARAVSEGYVKPTSGNANTSKYLAKLIEDDIRRGEG